MSHNMSLGLVWSVGVQWRQVWCYC
jgi:hypothetical protein